MSREPSSEGAKGDGDVDLGDTTIDMRRPRVGDTNALPRTISSIATRGLVVEGHVPFRGGLPTRTIFGLKHSQTRTSCKPTASPSEWYRIQTGPQKLANIVFWFIPHKLMPRSTGSKFMSYSWAQGPLRRIGPGTPSRHPPHQRYVWNEIPEINLC